MTETYNIQKIQNKELGWEKEWHLLLEALLFDEDGESTAFKEDYAMSGPLGRLCFKLMDVDEKWRLEDFVFFVCDQYNKRVKRQTLFAKFDPERGNPIQFLCSPKYLDCYLKKFRTENIEMVLLSDVVFHKSDDDDENSNDFEDQKCWLPEEVIVHRKLEGLYNSLANAIVINCPKKGTRLYKQAGLQLYEILSATDEQMILLKSDTYKMIAEIHSITENEADSKICENYEADRTQIENKIFELNQKLRENRYREYENREKDRQKVLRLGRDYIFVPLSNRSLEELLHMSPENVARCLSRYLEKLPELCDGYQKKFEAILQEMGVDDE